jgi:hypothetical protein
MFVINFNTFFLNFSRTTWVSIIDLTRRINPMRSELDPIQYDLKIKKSDMDLIFFIRIGSDRVWINSIRPN